MFKGSCICADMRMQDGKIKILQNCLKEYAYEIITKFTCSKYRKYYFRKKIKIKISQLHT